MSNLIKVAVGVDTIEHLRQINDTYALENQGNPYTLTRSAPRRADEILNGGSLYRVIKGFICCRQLIKAFTPSTRLNGQPCIKIILDRKLIRTYSSFYKPFQGWRYLSSEQAPKDLEAVLDQSLEYIPESLYRSLMELKLI